MSDEYEHVARGKLKLKTDSSKVSKKKKKKDKKNREQMEREHETNYSDEKLNNIPQAPVRTMTKAELSFKKMQEKMVSIEICTLLFYGKFIFKFKHSIELRLFVCISARETYHGEGNADT